MTPLSMEHAEPILPSRHLYPDVSVSPLIWLLDFRSDGVCHDQTPHPTCRILQEGPGNTLICMHTFALECIEISYPSPSQKMRMG
jgi:hypothetical protein